jgi:hypothetical protein
MQKSAHKDIDIISPKIGKGNSYGEAALTSFHSFPCSKFLLIGTDKSQFEQHDWLRIWKFDKYYQDHLLGAYFAGTAQVFPRNN